ncbi:hypothetical protein AB7M17_003959 [Bradyrhizobium sp. USDA 377]
MQDDHEAKVRALVADLNARATLNPIRERADELAALVQAIRTPFPATLPTDPDEREFALLLLALRARDHARRLLALVECGM